MSAQALLIAVGVPLWPHLSPGWDWWPIVGIAVMLSILRGSLGASFSLPMLAAAMLGGALFASSIHAWGVLPTSLVVILTSIAARRLDAYRATRRADPGV